MVELRRQAPQSLVSLTRLTEDPAAESGGDGWLIEVELPGGAAGELPAALAAPLEETICDLRILGLGPTVLVPIEAWG
ncbi:MAG: hypothetical protein JST31_03170 [Actinobacteria bacterium]|nr:hypothetical protein [Actinomycetota bacterium]